MNQSHCAAVIAIPYTTPERYQALKDALFVWRETWTADIGHVFVTTSFNEVFFGPMNPRGRLRVLVIDTLSLEALAALPTGAAARIIPPLLPVRGVVATYQPAAGTTPSRHFAPGEMLYCHPPYSGDGYERILVTGRHRETHRFCTIIFPTKRLEQWRAEMITHPAVIYELRDKGGWGSTLRPADDALIDEIVTVMQARTASRAAAAQHADEPD